MLQQQIAQLDHWERHDTTTQPKKDETTKLPHRETKTEMNPSDHSYQLQYGCNVTAEYT
jgi:hypothetical protein